VAAERIQHARKLQPGRAPRKRGRGEG
jgi:hypothetical protein